MKWKISTSQVTTHAVTARWRVTVVNPNTKAKITSKKRTRRPRPDCLALRAGLPLCGSGPDSVWQRQLIEFKCLLKFLSNLLSARSLLSHKGASKMLRATGHARMVTKICEI